MPEEQDTNKISTPENPSGEEVSTTVDDGNTGPEKEHEIFERINGKEASFSTGNTGPQNPGIVIKSLRTFQGDVAEAIKNQGASVLSIAMAEQQKQSRTEKRMPKKESLEIPEHSIVDRILGAKHRDRVVPTPQKTYTAAQLPTPAPPPPAPPPTVRKPETKGAISKIVEEKSIFPTYSRVVLSPEKKDKLGPDFKKNVFTIIVSIILIVSGIGAVIGLYIIQSKEPTIIGPSPSSQALVAFDKKETVTINDLGREDLIGRLNEMRRTVGISNNEVLFISLEETLVEKTEPINTQRLFSILDTDIPGATLRSFSDMFMLGMYGVSGSQPFIIIKISSFDNAFDGMLKWEKTLNKDLGSIFSTRAIPITEFTTADTATSTQGSTSTTSTTRIVNVDIGINENFEDLTIRNKDARILKNTRGDTILLYSFLDRETLLITSGEGPLREIINKLNAQKLIR